MVGFLWSLFILFSLVTVDSFLWFMLVCFSLFTLAYFSISKFFIRALGCASLREGWEPWFPDSEEPRTAGVMDG